MTDQPKLFPYIVAISFHDGGPLYVNAMIAPNEAVAAACITAEFFQKAGTDKAIMGVSVATLTPEFLRIAIRAYEGQTPGDQNIVSLVPEPQQQPEPVPDYMARWNAQSHPLPDDPA